jgi:hypothetical protein
MYDELVMNLKDLSNWSDFAWREYAESGRQLIKQAADAIEELIAKLNHADDQIDRLVEAAEERRWIPAKERLPEAMQKVLVATYHGGVYFGFMEPRGKFVTANNTLADSWCWEPSVTHWMPLPEPPKEE